MTFLTPIPAIIAASITVPILIAYYLLKLRRRPVRVSSTLLWMQAVRDVQVNVPFRWLRPTWLLLLQLAVLGLLLTAMARPAVDAAGGTPTQLILIVDRTASMSAIDEPGGPTRLEVARREAQRTIDELARGATPASIAVIAKGHEPIALTSFTTDRGRLRAALDSITPTDQPGATETGTGTGRGIQAALDLASAMLAGDVEELAPREHGMVILFSDGVSAARESYTLAGDFRYVQIGATEPPPNLGIAAISARRDWEQPSLVRIFTRIVSGSAEMLASPVAVLVDGEEIQRSAVEVPGTAESEDGAVGESAATFRLDLRDGGVVTVRLLHEDALATDNEASIVVDPARRARVMLVIPDRGAPEGEERPRRGPEWFITEVIGELHLPLRVVEASVFDRDMAAGASVPADLVIFDRVSPQRLPSVPTMSFGGGLPLDSITVEASDSAAHSTQVLSWRRAHPILRHITLDALAVGRTMRIQVDAERAREARVQVEELARGSEGPLLLLLKDRQIPRLLVGFELMQSNWPVQWSFPVFMAAAIDYLTLQGDANAGRAFTTIEPAYITVPAGTSRLVLDGPQRLAVDLPRGAARDARRINLGMIEAAGIYRIAGADETPDNTIAVNLTNQTESTLAGRDTIRVGGEVHAARTGSAGPREVWHWFILGALGVLCIEWLVHARRMRV